MQEEFWRGDFGVAYTARNRPDWRARIPFWRDILAKTDAHSVLDVGTNAGWNLRALRQIDPMLSLWGVDVNQAAIQEAADAGLSVAEASIFDLADLSFGQFDLVATSGVLIHVSPADIERAMAEIVSASRRYVLAVEYAAEMEEEVPYRGHSERLWRRPFGSMYEAMGLKMVAEGEAPADAFDRCSFWLLEIPA